MVKKCIFADILILCFIQSLISITGTDREIRIQDDEIKK